MKKWLLIIFLFICFPCYAGVEFDGADDYISFGTAALGVTDKITVAGWMYVKSDNTSRLAAKHAGLGNYG